MKNLWALRYVMAMLAALAAALACFVWVVREFPMYASAGILIVVAAVIINRPYVRRQQERIRASVEDALRRSYAPLPISPKLMMSSSYGYPAFEVSFGSKREMEAAAACSTAFKEEIATLFKSPTWFKGWGPFFQPFNADKAIFFTYDGYLDELRASHAERNHSWKR